MLPTPYRQLALAGILATALGGCDAAGQVSGTRTFSNPGVPFTFRVPTDFTNASIDEGDTRGDVVAGAGFTKVDVIAVRRVAAAALPPGPVTDDVQGHKVTSELHPIGDGYAIECQYTSQHAAKVRAACRAAVASVRRR